MNAALIPLTLTVVTAALAAWSWHRRRRITAVLVGVVALGAALVAIRDLREPVTVSLLLAALAAVAVVTAWPWLVRGRRARSRKEDVR